MNEDGCDRRINVLHVGMESIPGLIRVTRNPEDTVSTEQYAITEDPLTAYTAVEVSSRYHAQFVKQVIEYHLVESPPALR